MAPKKNKGKEKEPTPPASPTSSSSTPPSIRREFAGEEDDGHSSSDPEIDNWFEGEDREHAALKEVVPQMVSVRAREIRTKRRFDRPEQYNLNIQSPESLPARTKGGQKLTAKHRKQKEQEAAAAKAAKKLARAAAADRWNGEMGVPSTGTSGAEGNSIRGVSSGGGAGRGGASRKQARAAPAPTTQIEQEEEEPADQEEDNV